MLYDVLPKSLVIYRADVIAVRQEKSEAAKLWCENLTGCHASIPLFYQLMLWEAIVRGSMKIPEQNFECVVVFVLNYRLVLTQPYKLILINYLRSLL